MKLYRCYTATTEIERLGAKYHGLWQSVEQFERLLSHGIIHGHDRYSGLQLYRGTEPASIWKARVIRPQLGGKRSGIRNVYERLAVYDEDYAVTLAVYLHQQSDKESEIIARIRQRSRSFEATIDGLRSLERPHTEDLSA